MSLHDTIADKLRDWHPSQSQCRCIDRDAPGHSHATVDASQTVLCDVCEGRGTVRTTTSDAHPCSRCRGRGRRDAHLDPMAAPHVAVTVPAFGGSVRLRSASGALESLWISLHDDAGREVAFDDATRSWRPAPVRLTPNDARALAKLLCRYAATHKDTTDD